MTPYLRAANVKDGVLDLSDVKEMNFTPSEREVFQLRPGDVLVTEGAGSLAAVGAAAVWSGELDSPVCFQNTLLRLRPRTGTDGRYLAWWARHAYGDRLFAAEATGVNIFHLSADRVRSMGVAIPSETTQRAIADFLDAETARIESLAQHKRRLVELAQERHSLLVRHACSVDPSGETRPLSPLRRRWTVTDCKHRTPSYLETGYPVVSPGDVTPGTLDLRRCHRFVGESDFRELTEGRLPRGGDIIYSRNASIGIASYVATNDPFTMGQDVCLIRSNDHDQRFLTAVLNSFGVDQLEEMKIGSTFSRVNISQILDLMVPDVDPNEQAQIARRVAHMEEHHRRLVVVLDRSVELLQERKQALITAAVTGQLDLARDIAEEAS